MKTKRYQVLDGSRLADHKLFSTKSHFTSEKNYKLFKKTWGNSIFDTFEKAREYAWKWIGPEWGGSVDGKKGCDLKPNVPLDYSGYGDFIEIREID